MPRRQILCLSVPVLSLCASAMASPLIRAESRAWLRIDTIEVDGTAVTTSPLLSFSLLQWSFSGSGIGVPPMNLLDSATTGQYVPELQPEFTPPLPLVGDYGGLVSVVNVDFLAPALYSATMSGTFSAGFELAAGGHQVRVRGSAWVESSLIASPASAEFHRNLVSSAASVGVWTPTELRTAWYDSHQIAPSDTVSSLIAGPTDFAISATSPVDLPVQLGVDLTISQTLSATLVPSTLWCPWLGALIALGRRSRRS
jgi:hypothetical protein